MVQLLGVENKFCFDILVHKRQEEAVVLVANAATKEMIRVGGTQVATFHWEALCYVSITFQSEKHINLCFF